VPRTLIDDRYELRGPVGSGGMADVFLAHDEVLDRDVALKLLKDQYADDEEFVERFKREAQSAAALSHPNIVSIFDRGESEDGTYYIAMEYLPGGTLKDRILKRGALPPQVAAEVALQTAEALQAAHKRGIIHRDIKPRNILITDSGHVKVTDFGIARAADATTTSHLGDILGTAKYMSPEQAMGEPVGAASDLYSLGVVLYEMLTGRVPFEAETPADVSVKHADGLLPNPREVNPEVPEAMDALVMRLLASDPGDRYGSASELIEELRRVRDGLPPLSTSGDEATTATLAAPVLPTPGSTGPRRRSRWSWTLAAFVALIALLAAVGGAVGWNLWQDHNDRMILVTAALLVAFALLLWAFGVLLWDLLEGRTRRWLRVVLVALLAPACALAAAVVSAVAALALVTALEPDEVPVSPSKPPAHTAPAGPETTTEETSPETASDQSASPSAAPTSSPSASASATPSATPSPSASPSP
jgi:tRNA A-37 threonylcarbamoyl transferase component Bud32